MVRVLHVIGAMDRGGAETMAMNLYREIDRERVQFDFLVHEERECDYDTEIKRLGGRIHRLPRFVGLNICEYRSLCRDFFASHSEYPIVHGHIGSCAAIYLSEAKRAGRFAIAHSHAQNFGAPLENLSFRLVSYPTRYVADWFFGCSMEAGLDRFGRSVVEGERFSVLDNGIDLGLYRCDEATHRQAKLSLGFQGQPLFGHVGRLAPEKNHRFLFEVFARIKTMLPESVLLLVGRGPLEGELAALAEQLGIDDSVRFLGVRDDVPFLLKAMDVFIFPSTKEGLAMAAVEAQASGLPCVMSTGVPERAVASEKAVRIPLSEGTAAWASEAVSLYGQTCGTGRADGIDQVRDCGFDISQTARRLQAFYERIAIGEKGVRF